jgi:hypothetical protein
MSGSHVSPVYKEISGMRFCRFGDGRLGLVEGSNVRDVTAALDLLPSYRHPLPEHDVLIANLDHVADPGDIIITGTPEGVSPIVPGDVAVASIEKIGSMEVKVRVASDVSAIGHA